MILDLEENFINNYINPLYQDRLLFEFRSPKKRLDALMRFSHNIDKLVKRHNLILKLKKITDDATTFLLKEREVYVISFKYLEGTLMSVNDALNYITNEYMPVIILSNNIVVIKTEYEMGEANLYFLKNNN